MIFKEAIHLKLVIRFLLLLLIFVHASLVSGVWQG